MQYLIIFSYAICGLILSLGIAHLIKKKLLSGKKHRYSIFVYSVSLSLVQIPIWKYLLDLPDASAIMFVIPSFAITLAAAPVALISLILIILDKLHIK